MKQIIRFGFGIDEGPNAGLVSAGWRMWVNRDDTYLTAKSFEGTWKVSLHGDVAWRLAVTSEHQQQSEHPVWTDHDRAPWKFQPTPWAEGRRLAFVVAIMRSALLPGSLDQDSVRIPVSDRWNELTSAFVWMTEHGVSLDDPGVLAPPLVLRNGRQVWLTQNREQLDLPDSPEPPSVGASVEPLWPERHDVSAPGILLRGVHWG